MFTPKYKKISELLFNEYLKPINNNLEIMPTEEELCKQYGASRTTIRSALSLLAQQGYLKHTKSKGYTIESKKENISTEQNTLGFYIDALQSGKKTKTTIIKKEIIAATPYLSMLLGINKEQSIFHMLRIRYLDDMPYSLTENYVPVDLYPDIINAKFSDGSLWNYLKTVRNRPKIAQQDVEVRPALGYEKYYLHLNEEIPVMVVQNTSTSENRIVDYSIIITNAFKSKLRITHNKQ